MTRRARPVTAVPRTVPVGQMRRNLEDVQRFRLSFAFGAVLVLFLGLLGRLAKLQLVDAATYGAAASRRTDRQVEFQGQRGRILDAHGRTLVTSRRVLSVSVDPALVSEPRRFAVALAAVLDDADIAPRIYRRIVEADPGCRYVRIQRPLAERLVPQVSLLRDRESREQAGLRGLIIEEEERRTYPNGDYAAHVLGAPPPEPGCDADRAQGVECLLHEELQGASLEVPVKRGGRGGPGQARRYLTSCAVDPVTMRGRDVTLTLDVVVQHYLETALDVLVADWQPEQVAAIVLDPQTGAILALANRPSYDPGRQAGTLNVCVQESFPPGSIFKPFTVAAALGLGLVEPGERIPLPRERVFVDGRSTRRVRDSHDNGEWDGCGDVVRILGHSSNVGVGELALRLRPEGLMRLMKGLGFDRPLDVGLGEDATPLFERVKGRWDCEHVPAGWSLLYPFVGLAYGQGLALSPLRLAACFAAFARDDARVVRPTLVPGGGGAEPDLPPVCASRADLDLVRAGLAQCVDEGTARQAFADCPYPVAGKTGTAQLEGTPFDVAGFAGFAPRERPRVLVLVMAKVAESTRHPATGGKPYGGAVAGPAARSVIERTLTYLEGRAGGDGTSPTEPLPAGTEGPAAEEDR
jgi:cell division protein FtsI/penicillin-binding protein 2